MMDVFNRHVSFCLSVCPQHIFYLPVVRGAPFSSVGAVVDSQAYLLFNLV